MATSVVPLLRGKQLRHVHYRHCCLHSYRHRALAGHALAQPQRLASAPISIELTARHRQLLAPRFPPSRFVQHLPSGRCLTHRRHVTRAGVEQPLTGAVLRRRGWQSRSRPPCGHPGAIHLRCSTAGVVGEAALRARTARHQSERPLLTTLAGKSRPKAEVQRGPAGPDSRRSMVSDEAMF